VVDVRPAGLVDYSDKPEPTSFKVQPT